MKTTIELPDELLMRAKATAAVRRTSLKAMIEHALKRELDYPNDLAEEEAPYVVNEHGFPIIKSKHIKKSVSSEDIYKMSEELGI
jgi:hypothetical protein